MAVACTEPVPDEQQIRLRIADMVSAARDKQLTQVLAPLHEDFLGNGRLRKTNIQGLIFLHFRNHKNVHVFISDIDVKLQGHEAMVTCNLALAGRNDLLPEQGRVLQITSQWRKSDDDWQVMRASWHDPVHELL